VLGLKTVLEEGSIGVTVLKYSAVFMVKLLINIPNDVGSDFLSSAQNCIL
jgi:hypoxanthine-guanine phosphoribosyltransferase